MKKTAAIILCLFAAGLAPAQPRAATRPAPKPAKPKLILALAVDQFRYDYLTRFAARYNSGFHQLLNQGAVFTNAYLEHFPSVTAVGHATYLTGGTPSMHGIVGNNWFDRATGKGVTSVSDDSVKTLGAPSRQGASPHRLLTSTVGDELKMSGKGRTKVVSISVKDRSAIMPGGRMADGAYWFDNDTGNFVSSTWYFPDLPGWVKDFNSTRVADKYAGVEWTPIAGGPAFLRMPGDRSKKLYSSMERSPYGNMILVEFAQRAIEAEQLGRGDFTDVLAVSLSCNDYVGHPKGPDSPEVEDMSVRTDRLLGDFFKYLEGKIGMKNILVVVTADHGVAPVPEVNRKRKMPGGRIAEKTVLDTLQKALEARFGAGKWVAG